MLWEFGAFCGKISETWRRRPFRSDCLRVADSDRSRPPYGQRGLVDCESSWCLSQQPGQPRNALALPSRPGPVLRRTQNRPDLIGVRPVCPPRPSGEISISGFGLALPQVAGQHLVNHFLDIGEEKAAAGRLHDRDLSSRVTQRRGDLVPAIDRRVGRNHHRVGGPAQAARNT